MKVYKFLEFINENVYDTPEEYVKIALNKIKVKIESYFENNTEKSEKDVISMSDAIKSGKDKESDKSSISFQDLGLELVSSEFSKYSAVLDSVKFIFTDSDGSRYDLYITIPLEEAIIRDKDKDFSDKDIKKCFVKFKKYDFAESDGEMSPPVTKNIDIDSIDEDFLINLKIDLEDNSGKGTEKLEIDTN